MFCPDSCRYRHQVGQYLEMLGLGSGVDASSRFIIETVQDFLQQENSPNLLISGAEDYAVLAQVAWAARLANRLPDVTVLGRCPTVLRINQWFANRAGWEIRTVKQDLLRTPRSGPGRFDLLLGASEFLGNCPGPDRATVLDRWYDLLRPGGQLVTAVPLRGMPVDAVNHPVRATPEEAARIAVRAAGALAASIHRDEIADADFSLAVTEFALNTTEYPLDSSAQVQQELQHHRFDVIYLNEQAAAIPALHVRSSDTSERRYAQLVARRR